MSDSGQRTPPRREASPEGHSALTSRGQERSMHAAEHGFELVERLLIYLVALFLVGFAALSLINTVVLVKDPIFLDHDYTRAITVGFDAVFLTIILLEVLHTVLSRSSLTRQVQEFLVIGITSAVRHSLALVASGSATHEEPRTICNTIEQVVHHAQRTCRTIIVSVPNTSSQEVVIELAITAGAVLLLVAALWLVRQQGGRPQD